MKNSNNYIFPILIFLVAIIGFWQVAFMLHPLKYDMLDGAYPSYYNIGESIRHHMLPLWNPYQNLGYPIGSDPQSTAWYPLTWMIALLFGYNIYSLHFEFMFHIFFAGIGLYYFSQVLCFDRKTGFIMAISYMLSGFFIGNAQHINWLISGTWIPFVLASYVNLFNKMRLKDSLLAAFFNFLLLTGGYPGATIILFYLLIILFVFFIIKFIKIKKLRKIISFIKLNLLAIAIVVLLSSAYLISVYIVLPYLDRANGLKLNVALFNPLSFNSLISFILPFAAVNKDMSIFRTDLSMSNIYIGLIPLIFFFISFLIKKPALFNLFTILGLLCFCAALGSILPVRTFLFRFIPFMNLFRFPSLFRLFAIIFFILLSGYAIDKYFKEQIFSGKYLKTVTFIILISLIIFFIYSISLGKLQLRHFIIYDLIHFPNKSHIRQHIFFQSVIQIIIILSFIIILYKKRTKHLILFISIIVTVDMLIASQLNSPYTVYYSDFSVKQVRDFSTTIPEGYPIPANKNIALNSDSTSFKSLPIWRNLNIFRKQIAADGYITCRLSNYNLLADSLSDFFYAVVKNLPVYLSESIFPIDTLKANVNKKKTDKFFVFKVKSDFVYLNLQDYKFVKSSGLELSKGDTAYITNFSPCNISINANTKKQVLINLLQSNYPGWKVFINGKQSRLFNSNINLMSALLPPGNNKVDFIYSAKSVTIAFYISAISFLFIVFTLLFLSFITKTKSHIS